MINPVWLQTFVTLVQEQHFTRTAQQLHMTQSGVSQHIAKLEASFGLLLKREGKRFTLTDGGQRLYQESLAIVATLEGLKERVVADPLYEGSVRVISPGSVGLALYPQLLALQQSHPKLSIDYRFAPNHDVEAALLAGRADIGLSTQISQQPQVASQLIAHESLQLVLPKHCEHQDWDSLMALGFINHPDGMHHANLLLAPNFREFSHTGQLPIAGFCNQIHLILQPVAMGLGFTVLPQYAVAAFVQSAMIRVVDLPQPVSEPLYLCEKTQQHTPARVKTVQQHIKSAIQGIV